MNLLMELENYDYRTDGRLKDNRFAYERVEDAVSRAIEVDMRCKIFYDAQRRYAEIYLQRGSSWRAMYVITYEEIEQARDLNGLVRSHMNWIIKA